MRVRLVAPDEVALLRSWYDAYRAGLADGRPDAVIWSYEEIVAQLAAPAPRPRTVALAALDEGDAMVGGARMWWPRAGDLSVAYVELAVAPTARRRGVGSALIAAVRVEALRHGRTTLLSPVGVPGAGAFDEAQSVLFAATAGFELAHATRHSTLALPVIDLAPLDVLAEAAAGFRLVSWVDACPQELLRAYADLKTALEADMPRGELEVEPTVWTAEDIAARHAVLTASATTMLTTMAIAGDGGPAGLSQIAVPAHVPGEAMQDDTVVARAHRGHRLGVAMKLANLRILQAEHPDRRLLHTWVAEDNAPMLAVNDLFGFRQVEWDLQFQLRLG